MWFALWLACAKQSPIEITEPVILMDNEQDFWQEHPEWSGEVLLPKDQVLGHTVHFTVAEGQLTATMDIPMQNAMGLPLSDVVVTDNSLSFILKPPKAPKFAWAHYQFEKVSDTEWKGTLTQAKQTFPANLKAGEAKPLVRPQTPTPPFPYSVKEVVVPLIEEGAELAGTVVLPGQDFSKPDGGWPAVVFITGSGAQDRDETLFEHKPFAVIADHLARHGIASIRVDDRGVGGSTGVRENLTTVDFASDTAQVVDFIGEYPDVDASKVGLIGHSEGGLIAGIVASEHPVSFVVSMAGTGVNGLEVLVEQNLDMMQVSDTEARAQFKVDYTKAVESEVKSDAEAEGVDAVLRLQTSQSKQTLTPEIQEVGLQQFQDMKASAWFQTFLSLEPSEYWSKVTVPVLILNGDKDVQVSAGINPEAIQEALPSETAMTIEIVEGVNHLFQEAETGQVSEYAVIEQTISPNVLDVISEWIVNQSQ